MILNFAVLHFFSINFMLNSLTSHIIVTGEPLHPLAAASQLYSQIAKEDDIPALDYAHKLAQLAVDRTKEILNDAGTKHKPKQASLDLKIKIKPPIAQLPSISLPSSLLDHPLLNTQSSTATLLPPTKLPHSPISPHDYSQSTENQILDTPEPTTKTSISTNPLAIASSLFGISVPSFNTPNISFPSLTMTKQTSLNSHPESAEAITTQTSVAVTEPTPDDNPKVPPSIIEASSSQHPNIVQEKTSPEVNDEIQFPSNQEEATTETTPKFVNIPTQHGPLLTSNWTIPSLFNNLPAITPPQFVHIKSQPGPLTSHEWEVPSRIESETTTPSSLVPVSIQPRPMTSDEFNKPLNLTISPEFVPIQIQPGPETSDNFKIIPSNNFATTSPSLVPVSIQSGPMTSDEFNKPLVVTTTPPSFVPVSIQPGPETSDNFEIIPNNNSATTPASLVPVSIQPGPMTSDEFNKPLVVTTTPPSLVPVSIQPGPITSDEFKKPLNLTTISPELVPIQIQPGPETSDNFKINPNNNSATTPPSLVPISIQSGPMNSDEFNKPLVVTTTPPSLVPVSIQPGPITSDEFNKPLNLTTISPELVPIQIQPGPETGDNFKINPNNNSATTPPSLVPVSIQPGPMTSDEFNKPLVLSTISPELVPVSIQPRPMTSDEFNKPLNLTTISPELFPIQIRPGPETSDNFKINPNNNSGTTPPSLIPISIQPGPITSDEFKKPLNLTTISPELVPVSIQPGPMTSDEFNKPLGLSTISPELVSDSIQPEPQTNDSFENKSNNSTTTPPQLVPVLVQPATSASDKFNKSILHTTTTPEFVPVLLLPTSSNNDSSNLPPNGNNLATTPTKPVPVTIQSVTSIEDNFKTPTELTTKHSTLVSDSNQPSSSTNDNFNALPNKNLPSTTSLNLLPVSTQPRPLYNLNWMEPVDDNDILARIVLHHVITVPKQAGSIFFNNWKFPQSIFNHLTKIINTNNTKSLHNPLNPKIPNKEKPPESNKPLKNNYDVFVSSSLDIPLFGKGREKPVLKKPEHTNYRNIKSPGPYKLIKSVMKMLRAFLIPTWDMICEPRYRDILRILFY